MKLSGKTSGQPGDFGSLSVCVGSAPCVTSYPDNPLKGLAAIGLEGNRINSGTELQ